MKQEEIFALFLQMPGVEAVHATLAQGNIKHYNVRVKTEDPQAINKLMTIWPFCTIGNVEDGLVADFVVKPEEVDEFYARLSKASYLAIKKKTEVALIFQLKRPITDDLKNIIAGSIRGGDKIIWGDSRMTIILKAGQDEAVRSVERRIKKILRQNYVDEEILIQQVI